MFSNIINVVLSQRNNHANSLKEIEHCQRRFLDTDQLLSVLSPFIIGRGKGIRSIIYLNNLSETPEIADSRKFETIALIELLHSASIIHDDVVDQNNRRRNADSFFKKYGSKDSILYGDLVLIKAVRAFLDLHQDSPIITKFFLKELETTAYGAILEQKLTLESKFSDYLEVISSKTGSLFRLSAFLGKFLSTGNFENSKDAILFGTQFGVIFQAQNDIDGYKYENYIDSEDFVQKNITLPIFLLKEHYKQDISRFLTTNQENYLYIRGFVKSNEFEDLASGYFNDQVDYFSKIFDLY